VDQIMLGTLGNMNRSVNLGTSQPFTRGGKQFEPVSGAIDGWQPYVAFEKRAAAKVRELLARESPPVLSSEQEAAIDEIVKEATMDLKA
jgi:hypothetical protein